MDSRSSWYTGLLLDHSVRDKWGGSQGRTVCVIKKGRPLRQAVQSKGILFSSRVYLVRRAPAGKILMYVPGSPTSAEP